MAGQGAMGAAILIGAVAGCGAGSEVIPYPGEAVYQGGRYFGTAADDLWFVQERTYVHWDGEAWSHVADMDSTADGNGAPADQQHTSITVAGPGLVVITEYNGQIFTLDTSGTRTDLGEPLEAPYSGSFAVTGFDGVVYAYQPYLDGVPEGTSPLFRRDAAGWVELPAPPAGDTNNGADLWATGPDTLWLFRTGMAVYDGATWVDHPEMFGDGHEGWLALAPTRIAKASLGTWAYGYADTAAAAVVPLEDPVGDDFAPRLPIGVVKDGAGVALLVDRAKDVSMSGIGTRWQHRIEAWELDADGYAGTDRVLETWRLEGGFEASPPNYLVDGTTIVQFVDGLHVWEAR